MKKRNLKSLELNKNSISKLNSEQINGGILWSWFWCKAEPVNIPAPIPHEPQPMPVSWTCPVPDTGMLSGCPVC